MRVAIVFEETGGTGFDVYLEGIPKERRAQIDAMTPEQRRKSLGTAEFYASECLRVVAAMLVRSGVANTVTSNPRG